MTISAPLANDLRPLLSPDALVTDAAALPAYGHDFWAQRGTPGIVVRAVRAEDVAATLRYAAERGVAVVPRAAGTNVSAGFLPTPERIMLDLRPMNRVLTIDTERRAAVVQPGVINGDLNARLAPLGFCFSPDPGSATISSIGGNIAENAGGMHCLKYGVTDDHVHAVECALIGGDTIRLAAGDSGPDLLGLLIGSEGTLGIVTQATVALRPLPAVTRTLLAIFDDADDAAAAVSATIAAGIIPAAMEFFDRAAVGFFDAFSPSGSGYPAEGEAFLLIDLDGSEEHVSGDMLEIEPILRRGARAVHRADGDAARAALWKPRIDGALALVASGRGFFICDTTVPRERIPEMQRAVVEIGQRSGLQTLTLGHAGDGNIHPIILFDKNNPAQVAAMEEADDAVVAAALALGGTITGEHGIGSEKRRQMRQRFSPTEIAAMRAVKAAFDPDDLLNPGILLPDRTADEPALPRFVATMNDLIAVRRAGRIWENETGLLASPPPIRDAAIELDAENLTVTANARTPLSALHETLTARGFRCALANKEGMDVADAISGQNDRAAARDALLAVETTLTDGQAARFGSNAVKDVAGYDMKRLFIGSGDAFGLMETVTLRVLPHRR
ncbi:MAG: FAD-binding protein [Chloroflexota bacterium]|nr:FAD-binding protein [Chloroflexota bacterium]